MDGLAVTGSVWHWCMLLHATAYNSLIHATAQHTAVLTSTTTNVLMIVMLQSAHSVMKGKRPPGAAQRCTCTPQLCAQIFGRSAMALAT